MPVTTLTFHPSVPAQGPAGEGPFKLVLLAEDDDAIACCVEQMLSMLGQQCVRVSNGAEAMATMSDAHAPFSLILMDVNMPVMDGIAAARGIRRMERERHREPVPIICFSSCLAPETRTAMLRAGATADLAKPPTLESLRACLDTWAGASRVAPEVQLPTVVTTIA